MKKSSKTADELREIAKVLKENSSIFMSKTAEEKYKIIKGLETLRRKINE